MGARPDWTLLHQNWFRIINDDFLEKGECYILALLPSIICLGGLRIACRNIFSLCHLCQCVDFLAQSLEHWIFIPDEPPSYNLKLITKEWSRADKNPTFRGIRTQSVWIKIQCSNHSAKESTPWRRCQRLNISLKAMRNLPRQIIEGRSARP